MCAIYTALAPVDNLATAIARDYVLARADRHFGIGRHAVCALAAAYAPSSHAAFAAWVAAQGHYMFATPGLAHRAGKLEARLVRKFGFELPVPAWPATEELAVIVGSPPARLLGIDVAWIDPEIVPRAAAGLAYPIRPIAEDYIEAARLLCDWLQLTAQRGDGVALRWAHC